MKIINKLFFAKKRQNICNIKDYPYLCTAFKKCNNMVTVVQLVQELPIVVLNVEGPSPFSHPRKEEFQ